MSTINIILTVGNITVFGILIVFVVIAHLSYAKELENQRLMTKRARFERTGSYTRRTRKLRGASTTAQPTGQHRKEN